MSQTEQEILTNIIKAVEVLKREPEHGKSHDYHLGRISAYNNVLSSLRVMQGKEQPAKLKTSNLKHGGEVINA